MALGTAIPAMDNGTRTCITTETMGIHMVTGAGVVEIKGLWGRGFRKQKQKRNKPNQKLGQKPERFRFIGHGWGGYFVICTREQYG